MIPATLKQLIKSSPLYPLAQAAVEEASTRHELRVWVAGGGTGAAPHRVKRGVIRSHAKRFGLRTLVETGTYLGGMIHALRGDFDRIHSVEVDDALHRLALRRFAGVPNVTLHHGDSATVLPRILDSLGGPAVFWLDGHYSGGVTSMGAKETPIVEEVTALLAHPIRGHVILIDDARCFGTFPDYPTLDALRAMVAEARPDLAFALEHDIIRLTPSA